jgi:uncharacterized membrane protein
MKYKDFFTKERVRSLFVAFLLIALALTFQYYASAESTRNSSRFVGDIFLDNLPVVNMNAVIIEGALLMIVVSVILLLCEPKYLLFAMKATAIFIAIRAFFVAATHLGIYPDQIVPGNDLLDRMYVALDLQAGYFFSAHTGLPFLLALIFWDKRFWRYFYFILSAIFGISVLLAHVHYSIDVFAAPFMTYSIYKLAQYLFPEDYKLIES